ncbi:MAG: TetR family transcriptional regulator [Actinomycetota bacterium]
MQMQELEAVAGVPRHEIHRYLKRGLLPKGTEVGYRRFEYGEAHVRRLRILRQLREQWGVPLGALELVLDKVGDDEEPTEELIASVVLSLPRSSLGKHTRWSRERVRHDIITAAHKVFRERGFQGASNADIASEANVALNTLSAYFASKEELFLAVVEQSIGRLQRAMDEGRLAAPDGDDRLARMGVAFFRQYFEEQPLLEILLTGAMSGLEPYRTVLFDAYQRLWSPFMVELQRLHPEVELPPMQSDLVVLSWMSVAQAFLLYQQLDADRSKSSDTAGRLFAKLFSGAILRFWREWMVE